MEHDSSRNETEKFIFCVVQQFYGEENGYEYGNLQGAKAMKTRGAVGEKLKYH
jgi:hypothetical protein